MCIRDSECVEYPELGMEAIWKITVEDFPAFILVDDKGNDCLLYTSWFLLTRPPMWVRVNSKKSKNLHLQFLFDVTDLFGRKLIIKDDHTYFRCV